MFKKFVRIYLNVFLALYRLLCVLAIALGLFYGIMEARLDRGAVPVEGKLKDNVSTVMANANRQGKIEDYTVQLFYQFEGREYSNSFSVSHSRLDSLVKGGSLQLELLPSQPDWSRIPGRSGVWGSLFFSLVAAGLLWFSMFLNKVIRSRMD